MVHREQLIFILLLLLPSATGTLTASNGRRFPVMDPSAWCLAIFITFLKAVHLSQYSRPGPRCGSGGDGRPSRAWPYPCRLRERI